MLKKFNQWIDQASEFLAQRKGLLPILGILLVLLSAVLQFLPFDSWFIRSNLVLHLGVLVAIIGFMLAWSL